MITYVSHMFASAAEAAAQLSIYQAPVEGAGGTISITTWERIDSDRTTRTTESTEQGETTVAVAQTVETVLQRGPVLLVALPEEIALDTVLRGSEDLDFKSVA